jgi:transcriptional regulator with XRE-family HTH domain
MSDFKKTLYLILGERIRVLRNELGYSQEYVAKLLGMGRASISNIEAGKHQIPLSTLYSLTNILEKDIFFILPTFKEVEERMTTKDVSDIETLLTKEPLNETLKSELDDIIKKL